jgi:hypothetical protein
MNLNLQCMRVLRFAQDHSLHLCRGLRTLLDPVEQHEDQNAQESIRHT